MIFDQIGSCTVPSNRKPTIFYWLFQLDDDSQIFTQEIVGNHHFHPLKHGWLSSY